MFAETYVRTDNGVKIFCRLYRKAGPWLVFLHGGGGSLSAWYLQEAFFCDKKYSLLFIDLRGHGLSDRGFTNDFFTIHNFSGDIATVLRQFGIKKAAIIGHCFGSVVARQFCAEHPGMVERMVLISAGKEPFKGGLRRALALALCEFTAFLPFKGVKAHLDSSRFAGSHDINVRRFFADVHCAGRKTCSSTYRITACYESPSIKTAKPVLLIHGRDDVIIPYKHCLELQQAFPNSTVKILNTNHIPPYNDGPGVNLALLRFLENAKSHSRSASRKHEKAQSLSVAAVSI
ncbi:alpha/beta hydrolase [Candidatus Woesearchaeota archaeon]|nr:alpha/beta hydrolase [Candidatus Woesearchaeota archaeon]